MFAETSNNWRRSFRSGDKGGNFTKCYLQELGFTFVFKESDVGPSKLNGPEVIETISVFFSQKQEKGVIFSEEFGFHLWCNGAQWTS